MRSVPDGTATVVPAIVDSRGPSPTTVGLPPSAAGEAVRPYQSRSDPRHGRKWERTLAGLATTLPCPCYRCGQTVETWHKWHGDHEIPVAHGGGITVDTRVMVSHAECNVAAGSAVRRLRNARPSRDW